MDEARHWFLSPDERGNPATWRSIGAAATHGWTEGNHVEVLVDGAEYFARLGELCELAPATGSTSPIGAATPTRCSRPGTELGDVLAEPRPARGARPRDCSGARIRARRIQRTGHDRARATR